MALVMIVPSRGRPKAVRDLYEAFRDTRQVGDTRLVFAVDRTDTTLARYRTAVTRTRDPLVTVVAVDGGRMVAALNEAAAVVVADPTVEAVGFLGDDHRPRIPGWDASYLGALRELGAGIVYGDDLVQHAFVPTQCAITADVVRAWGYMCPPTLWHMYVDTWWKIVGEAAGKLRYLPDVVVEHLHPIVGTAAQDAGYERVNAKPVYDHDEQAFHALNASGQTLLDADTLRRLAEAAA